MSAGLQDGDIREHYVRQSTKIVSELCSLLMEVLPGKEKYLYNLIQQLTTQRLPDKRVMESFSTFCHDLNIIINEGLLLYGQKQNIPLEEHINITLKAEPRNNTEPLSEFNDISNTAPSADDFLPAPDIETRQDNPLVFEDRILIELQKCFHNNLILTNEKYWGTNVDYYLPDIKLILMRPERKAKSYARLNYLAQLDNVKLIWLDERYYSENKSLCRRIKKKLKGVL
jgi:hypothetical protein